MVFAATKVLAGQDQRETMAKALEKRNLFTVNQDSDQLNHLIAQIKEKCGVAYSVFSGRPISLCKSLERRGELRIKFEEPIYLWPVELEDLSATCTTCQPIVSVTRDISSQGVGFGYDAPIETDYVIGEFDLYGEGTVHLLIEMRWHSQTSPHAFVAGGLILGVATEVHSVSE